MSVDAPKRSPGAPNQAHFHRQRFEVAYDVAILTRRVAPRFVHPSSVRVDVSGCDERIVAAGVTSRLWEIGDIVKVLEAWEQCGGSHGSRRRSSI